MFKINIHEVSPESVGYMTSKDSVAYMIRHKPTRSCKVIMVQKGSPMGQANEVSYQMYKRSRELMLDLLYNKYGDACRMVEAKHIKQISKSIMRAVKFAK